MAYYKEAGSKDINAVIYGLNELETEIDVIVAVYKKRKDGEKTL